MSKNEELQKFDKFTINRLEEENAQLTRDNEYLGDLSDNQRVLIAKLKQKLEQSKEIIKECIPYVKAIMQATVMQIGDEMETDRALIKKAKQFLKEVKDD